MPLSCESRPLRLLGCWRWPWPPSPGLHRQTCPFTPDQSSTLVSTGIYRYSRNPMYLGFLLALAGWCVYLANWASMLLLPLFIVYMNRFQIAPEERALHRHFGQPFTNYTQAVRRWI